MFLFVYVLVLIINDCLQTQLCRLIKLCLSQFSKSTTRLLVWTCFPSWALSCIANSHEIVPVQARAPLSKEIQLLHTTLFQPVAFKGSVWLIWVWTITVPKAQRGVPLSICYCDQMLLSFRLFIFHVCSLSGLQFLWHLKLFQIITVI